MLKFAGILVVGAAIASSPLPAAAQTSQPGGATSMRHATPAHRPTGSYRSEMRRRGNLSRERARAGAEHVRKMHAQ
jgi:hypothetical protein